MFGAVSIGGFELLFILLIVAPLALLCTAFWVWMLVDAIKNRALSDTEKIIWVLVILFLHLLGALIYFFAGRTPSRSAPAR